LVARLNPSFKRETSSGTSAHLIGALELRGQRRRKFEMGNSHSHAAADGFERDGITSKEKE
jgi:hypothetical protein